jgi:multidrug efflux pump
VGDALADAMKRQKALTDVDTDQAENGVETYVDIDKDSAARLGISARDVDNALYNAFGQRQVANIYDELNQYHVIMGVAQKYAQSPEALKDVYVPAKNASGTPTDGRDQHRRHPRAPWAPAPAAPRHHRQRRHPGQARPT